MMFTAGLVPLLALVWRLLRMLMKGLSGLPLHPGWFAALIAAVLIPIFAAQLPGWMLPARWSDFDFWIQMAESGVIRMEEMFRMMPSVRELEGQWCIVRWMLGWGIAVVCLGPLLRRISDYLLL